jgi:hypothetical protein
MNRTFVLSVIIAILLGILVAFAVIGCRCKMAAEGFEGDVKVETDKPLEEEAAIKMDGEEEELFKDIQDGTLNDDDIQKLVDSGKITEKMVEKFLTFLDNLPSDPADSQSPPAGKAKAKSKAAILPKETEEGFEVEGFTGSMFARAR